MGPRQVPWVGMPWVGAEEGLLWVPNMGLAGGGEKGASLSSACRASDTRGASSHFNLQKS